MTSSTTTTAVTPQRATFLYDDCCPLCRTYTATFTALGWADRAPFSQVSDDTLATLDMDQARHQIPLVDVTTGTTQYGLDGILGVVTEHAPALGAIGQQRLVRRGLDGLYYLITYNRRHIVSAPPPEVGIDCAPDYEPKAIMAYLAFSSGASFVLGRSAPAALVATVAGAVVGTAGRHASWDIKPLVAAGHVGTVATATAATAALVGAAGASVGLRTATAVAIGARKVYLRRWMLRANERVAS